MLQEKDPSADEAFAAAKAMQQQSMQHAAGDEDAATAVDGFVPKFKPEKQLAKRLSSANSKANPKDSHSASEHYISEAAVPNTSGVKQVCTQDADGFLGQQNGLTPQDQSQAHSDDGIHPSRPPKHSSSSAGATQSNVVQFGFQDSKHLARISSTDPHAAAAAQSSSDSGQGQAASSEPATVVELEASSGPRPVLSFELEDAEGPLEGAAHGINAKFGRLKVLAAAQ